MVFDIGGFVQEHFIRPMVDPTVSGYNLVNTLTYGAILLAAAFYVIYPLLKKRGFTFDFPFLRALLPYILFGISLRVLEDQNVLARSTNPLELGFYVFTPGIWILTFALVVIGLVVGTLAGKRLHHPDLRITFGFGLIIALIPFVLTLLHAQEWAGAFSILVLVGALYFLTQRLAKHMRWIFFDHALAKTAYMGQLLDASATFVALEFFSCGEQHVIPRLLFGAFGNVSFFFVKIPLILVVLYYLDKEYQKEDPHVHGFILLFISILGLATGGRNTLTVLAGTCSI